MLNLPVKTQKARVTSPLDSTIHASTVAQKQKDVLQQAALASHSTHRHKAGIRLRA